MSELKDCPFCGEEAELIKQDRHHPIGGLYYYWVECTGCEISVPNNQDVVTPDDAIKVWNTRSNIKEAVETTDNTPKVTICPACDGTGYDNITIDINDRIPCGECDGTGKQ